MTVSADLGKTLEEYVQELVKSGRYRSQSEVLREGVRMVQDREMQIARFKQQIQKGIDEAERGEFLEIDDIFDELLENNPT